jgi:hypothetical protein
MKIWKAPQPKGGGSHVRIGMIAAFRQQFVLGDGYQPSYCDACFYRSRNVCLGLRGEPIQSLGRRFPTFGIELCIYDSLFDTADAIVARRVAGHAL